MEDDQVKLVDYSDFNIAPEKPLEIINISASDWSFHSSKSRMFSGKDHDNIEPLVVSGKLPDIFWGFSSFYFVFPAADFVYEINPLSMINFTSFETRDKTLVADTDEIPVSEISYYVPTEIKVQFAKQWAELKVENADIENVKFLGDWSFSSAYMGRPANFTDSPFKNQVSTGSFTIEKADKEQLPLSRLGPDNQILDFVQVELYEDELDDSGHVHGNFRFRLMKDCFLGLLRCYLRVDNVRVRILETRFSHVFGENYMLREFTVKENSYEELITKGWKFTSEWNLAPNQGDLIGGQLDVIFTAKDKIVLRTETTDNN